MDALGNDPSGLVEHEIYSLIPLLTGLRILYLIRKRYFTVFSALEQAYNSKLLRLEEHLLDVA